MSITPRVVVIGAGIVGANLADEPRESSRAAACSVAGDAPGKSRR
jgi:hypothetical protein